MNTMSKLSCRAKGTLFTNYQKLGHKMARQYAEKYGVQYEDVAERADWLLYRMFENWDKFDPSKSTANSRIHAKLRWGLLTFCTRDARRHKNIPTSHFTDLGTEDRPLDVAHKPGWLESLLREIGEDARVLLQTIISAPADIVEDLGGEITEDAANVTALARRAVGWALMGDRYGWTGDRVAAAWLEVEAAL